MKRFEIIFAAVIIAFVVVVVGAGALYYNYSETVMRFPYVVGSVIVVLAVWRIVAVLAVPTPPAGTPESAQPESELPTSPVVVALAEPPSAAAIASGTLAATESAGTATAHAPEESVGEILVTGLWLLGILPAVWIFGYLAGIPLYLLAYFRGHGERWTLSIVLSLAALAVTYLVFILLLKVRLPVLPIGF